MCVKLKWVLVDLSFCRWFITVLHLSLVVFAFRVLTETDHCYCVLVNALDGEAFPSEKDTNDSSSSNKVPLRVDTNSMKTKNTHTFFLDLSAIKWSGMHMMLGVLDLEVFYQWVIPLAKKTDFA
ncbi:hypothetical protein V6Z12_A03G065600 [Gossypium hirsutum]